MYSKNADAVVIWVKRCFVLFLFFTWCSFCCTAVMSVCSSTQLCSTSVRWSFRESRIGDSSIIWTSSVLPLVVASSDIFMGALPSGVMLKELLASNSVLSTGDSSWTLASPPLHMSASVLSRVRASSFKECSSSPSARRSCVTELWCVDVDDGECVFVRSLSLSSRISVPEVISEAFRADFTSSSLHRSWKWQEQDQQLDSWT